MKTLSLIIPIYNEQKTLFDVVNEVSKLKKSDYFINNQIELELIIVDDCSNDDSFKIAKDIEKDFVNEFENIKVLKNEINLGKGYCIKKGFKEAKGDFVGIQDADMEYSPNDYIKLLKTMIDNDADVCYGSRYLKKDSRRVLGFYHSLINKFLTFLTNIVTNLDLTDMEVCYKLFKKEVITKIAPQLKENRFGFEVEMTIYCAKLGYRFFECAIDYNPRSFLEGKKIKAKDGFRALWCILKYGLEDKKF